MAATATAHTTYRLNVERATGKVVRRGDIKRAVCDAGREAGVAALRDRTDGATTTAALARSDAASAHAAEQAAARFEAVERSWTAELERELRELFDSRVHQDVAGRWTERADTTGTYVRWAPFEVKAAPWSAPRATGKPSRDLGVLRRHLIGEAERLAGWRDAQAQLAAALVADIDAAAAAWVQPALAA